MTLIDTVVASALLLVVFMGISTAFQLSVDVVTNNKARAGAIALVDERMEYIRSLTYTQIGTSGGIPSGTVAQSETVSLNNISYTRRTTIEYGDDPYDGTGASDTYPSGSPTNADYKAVRVDVAWSSRLGTRHITAVTRIEPQNGQEVACSGTCGTLAFTVQDAASQPVSNAQVRVVNSLTSPTIDLITFTNASGTVTLVGSPVATSYQVTVSKTGYNSDQTYSTPPNAHLTVSQNNTTADTFRIDLLASKDVYLWRQVATSTWTESMGNEGNIATSTNITVAAGVARLSGSSGSYPTYGELQSVTFVPNQPFVGWRTFTWTGTTPAGTSVRFKFYDATGGALVPDAQLAGNSVGTTSASVDLSGISSSTYPTLRVDATLTSSNPNNTPTIDSYSFLYDYGPTALSSLSFSMQGAKVTASGPPAVYKYNATSTSDSYGKVSLPNIEWDTYTLSVLGSSGYDLASACHGNGEFTSGNSASFYLAPGTQTISNLYFSSHTTNSLRVDVSSGGAVVPGAIVSLWKSGTATTTATTDSCGDAFFSNISSATYFIKVATSTHTTYWNTSPGVGVLGASRTSVVLQ